MCVVVVSSGMLVADMGYNIGIVAEASRTLVKYLVEW